MNLSTKLLSLILFAALTLSACSKKPEEVSQTAEQQVAPTSAPVAASMPEEEKVLNVYNWPDYIAKDTIANFEKETGIKVQYDTFDDNESLHAKMVAGQTGYDIVIPSIGWGKLQMDSGLLQSFDKSKIPNVKNLDPVMLQQMASLDPENNHFVTWAWGYFAIGIQEEKVKKALGSMPMPDNAFDLIYDAKYISKLKSCGTAIYDSPAEIIPLTLAYLGKNTSSANEEDLKAVAEVLKKIRPYLSKFEASSGVLNGLSNGSLCVAIAWSGDVGLAKTNAMEAKKNFTIQTLVPKNSMLFMDVMAIPKDAPHPQNAHKFIDYILRAEVQAAITNEVSYPTANKASLEFVTPEVAQDKTIFLEPDVLGAMQPPNYSTAEAREAHNRLFQEFKAKRLK